MSVEGQGFEIATAYVKINANTEGLVEQVQAQLDEALTEGTSGIGDTLGKEFGGQFGEGVQTSLLDLPELMAPNTADLADAGHNAGEILGESVAEGVGSADIGSGLGSSLPEQMRTIGQEAGQDLAAGMASGTQSLDEVFADVEALFGEFRAVGEQAGEILAQGVEAGTEPLALLGSEITELLASGLATGLPKVLDEVQHLMQQLPSVVDPGAVFAGLQMGAALAAGFAGSSSTIVRGMAGALTASAVDAATEAGGAAGDALVSGISDSAAQGAGRAATRIAEAISAPLDDAMVQTGQGAGAALGGALQLAVDEIGNGPTGSEATLLGNEMGQFLARGLEESEPSVSAAAANIEDVFASLYRGGEGLSLSLANAFTDVFEGIEAATEGFTNAERVIWNQFVESFNTEGLDTAMVRTQTLARQIALSAPEAFDPVAAGVSSVGTAFKSVESDTADAGTALEKAGGSAEKAAGGFGGMASMMYGPWSMAIFGAMALLPMLGGSLSSLADAFEPTKAVLLNTQNLATALANDGNVAGEATAAFVAQSSATDGLAASAKQAGVSLATWTEAAMGNAGAQATVTDAVGKLNQAQLNQAVTTQENATQTGKFSGELQDAHTSVTAQSDATNRLTDANQKLINSMHAEADQVTAGIKSQTELAQATETLDMNSQILGATLDGLYAKMQLSAQQTAITSVANLNLGDSQTTLNTTLITAEQDYTEATQGASGYQSVLTALNGTALGAAQAQNNLASQMLTAKTTFDANSDSLDLNSKKGVADRQALVAASQAITAMGVSTYQTTGSMNAANQTISQQIVNFVNATGATGKAKSAIESYLQSITKIPPNVSTTVNANTQPALDGLSQVLERINSSSGTVTVYENSGGQVFSSGGGGVKAYASGGVPPLHEPVLVGEDGPEVVVFGTQGTVIPNNQLPVVGAGAGTSLGSATGRSSAGPTYNITFGDIQVKGIVDLTNPRGMTAAARQMVWQLRNAINVVEQQYGVAA